MSSAAFKEKLVSIENITPSGIWLFVKGKEYFLSYEKYPYFRDHNLSSIQNVQLLHGNHLYWSDLDVDLEIDNLENPEKYSLLCRTITAEESSHRLARLGGTEKQLRHILRRRVI
jgi:hypothetical protein